MKARHLLYPDLRWRNLPMMLKISAVGALIAGVYGTLHDQITYTLSEEYFSKFKAVQFQWADLGWPRRVYAGLIGFLATWWVGLISGWFLARLTVPHMERAAAVRRCMTGFGVVFLVALAGGALGAWLGWRRMHDADLGAWNDFCAAYGVRDVPHFVWVGFIHNWGYAGGLAGLLAAMAYAWLGRK